MTTKSRADLRHQSAADLKIAHLEDLVDELVKDSPQESRIRACMEAAGIKYSADPIVRMSTVMTAIDELRNRGRQREKDA